jgi:S1-C subfamily serine protease
MRIVYLLFLSIFTVSTFAQSKKVLDNVLTVAVFSNTKNRIPMGYGEAEFCKAARSFKAIIGAAEIGTGFVYRYNNVPYLVTSTHVIDAAKNTLGNIKAYDRFQNEYILEMIGGDTFYDVAVLRFKKGSEIKQFTGLKFGNATEKLDVIAAGAIIGNVQGTILKELVFLNGEKFVSKHNRYLKSSTKVTRGYSGGPLCSMSNSAVVGINICRNKSLDAAYALKGQFAEKHIQEIITNNGRIIRSFLGFEWKQSKFENTKPILSGVLPGSPASKYKRYIGYELVKINSQNIENIFETLQQFEKIAPNKTVKLTLKKGTKSITLFLITQTLNTKALENIATYAFSEHSKYYINTFSGAEESYTESTIYFLKQGMKITPYDRLDMVQSVGIGEWAIMYQIITLEDVGVVIKLSSLFGEQISVKTKKQHLSEVRIQPHKFKLYDNENSYRVLYY